MTLNELRDKADAKLAIFWSHLVAKQDAYFAKHGKYFQLLITPSTPVVDGVDSNFLERNPSDEAHILDVDFQFADQIPFNITVDEWVGNDKGYTATAKVELPNGRMFQRSRNSNNEDSGWNEFFAVTPT